MQPQPPQQPQPARQEPVAAVAAAAGAAATAAGAAGSSGSGAAGAEAVAGVPEQEVPATFPDADDDMAALGAEASADMFAGVDFTQAPALVRKQVTENWTEMWRKKSRRN